MTGLSIAASWRLAALLLVISRCSAFVPSASLSAFTPSSASRGLANSIVRRSLGATSGRTSGTALRMGLDLVTYLRTEWVSAALCTNQTPRSADTCLQLGTEDGRAVTFVPKTIRELITSSAESDGKLSVSARRQLKQQADRRKAATIRYVDQRADDLTELGDETVDIVISLQAAERMRENGLNWKRSVREAARVLKPGGRLLFVEQATIDGESYLDYIDNLYSLTDEEEEQEGESDSKEGEDERYPVFDEVGYDEVDLVIVPHMAGVAIKSVEAGLTPAERAAKAAAEEEARLAELSISAFERGNKKRRKKKKKKKKGSESEAVENP